ncbi:YpjP family protein [Bacillus weihaiensis]|uniref:Cell division protein FtsK n=1 Tax=Bacillus weihaiensis TaxID=1547283 RepID=A0A1L3MR17_9BACI|nr:YpjP family protein [Bacillus weihaiensis]APH04694.1 hypothetical protein A9C19_07995 [Bacillus weihaiensis]
MNKWMKKSLVILFSIATLGLVTPPASLALEDKPSEDNFSKSNFSDSVIDSALKSVVKTVGNEQTEPVRSKEDFLSTLIHEAEEKSFMKFGNKIGSVIENEFKDVIFPKIEEVITHYLNEEEDEQFKNLEISMPSAGTGEKIFHIYNTDTGEDVLRFHVRRENKPLEGYWFNFHYHTYHDSFVSHKDLGSIYWNKNTPPNWMNVH